MKTNKYILALCLVYLSSCNILEEDPESFISPENFYQTESDALAATTASYAALRTNGDTNRNYAILLDVTTDDMFPLPINNDRVQLDTYTHTPQNSIVREAWQNFYRGITRANTAIDRIPSIKMNEPLRDRLVAENKFLRGFYYFHLVRMFGEVPLIVKEVASLAELEYPARSSVDVVYQQIIKDFTDAEAILPLSYNGGDRGRATKGAAMAFLASVYLTRGQYDLAAQKAKEVMDPAMGYGLWENYADVFAIPNEFGKEAIFDAQFISGPAGQGSNLIAFFAQENNTVAGRGFGSFQPTEDLFGSFDAEDNRLDVFFTTGTDGKQYCNKWVDADAKTSYQSDNNYPYMRYAEVVLTFAEASNQVSGPTQEVYDAVNAIRGRAGLAPLDGLSKEQLHDAILLERRHELCFEGKRWYDLVRTDRLVSTMQAQGNTNVQEYHRVFPIPQFEIDLNENLKPQNPGYSD